MNPKLTKIVSYIIPKRVYLDSYSAMPTETVLPNGNSVVLNHYKTFGEEVAYVCYGKDSKEKLGFIVKNIKYGYFGEVCKTVQEALDSENAEWFRFMGIKPRQKQR